MWHTQDTIAVIQLLFYIPTIFLSVYVCSKHGFKRSSGWLYTLILCLVRIIGSICQFLSHRPNPSTGLLQTIFILDSVGISPLLLATLGILSRFVDCVNAQSRTIFTTKHFRIIQILIIVALGLAISGGTSISPRPNGTYETPGTSKAGCILYIVGFAAILFVLVFSVPKKHLVSGRERYVPVVLFLAVPFIAVRLLYSVLSVFLRDRSFSIVAGSVGVRVCMSVVEEFIVVGTYVALGVVLEKLEVGTGDGVNRPWVGHGMNQRAS